MGDLSPHFSAAEFRCHCIRRHDHQPQPPASLLTVLETLRNRGGRPLPIVSGYRCPAHNTEVGGAPNSFHLRGLACDIPAGRFTVAEALAAGARGVGYRAGWAVHLDVRAGAPVTFRD